MENAERYLHSYGIFNLSIITYYELLNGLLYKDARKQLQHFESFSDLNKILPLTISATRIAAGIYADLRKKVQTIGHSDCLIAGIALTNELQIVTNNTDHFKRIKKLELINWSK